MIKSCVRLVFASTCAALLFALAPAAAQELRVVEGTPIAFRMGVPDAAGWDVSNDSAGLTVGRSDLLMMVSATDLAAMQAPPAGVSRVDQRRILTQRFMGSDSAMMALMTRVIARSGVLERDGLVMEARTLGGQRAAYLRDRATMAGALWSRQAYITVKDAVMYLVVFFVKGNDPDAHKDLVDRVQRSFVLAEAPPS